METRSWQRFEVDQAETTKQAIAMAAGGRYAAVLMQYNLPGRGGLKAVEIIHSRWPSIAVTAVVDTDEAGGVDRIVGAGAKGSILRNVELGTLVDAIRTLSS